jgi:hypothetical protein
VSFLALGRRANVVTARALGWKVRNVEVCADFTGLHFFEGDPKFFAGPRGAKRIDSGGFRPDGAVETIEIGKRARDRIALETHEKSAWLRKRQTDAATSVYAGTWRAGGWDARENVRRVEVRAHGKALVLRAKGSGPGLDLSDPAALLDAAALAALWRHATTTSRLVMPGRTRLRRADTDPRWLAVHAAGDVGADAGPRLVVAHDPDARTLAAAERVRRAKRALLRSAAELALLDPDSATLLSDLPATLTTDGEADAAQTRARGRVGHLVAPPTRIAPTPESREPLGTPC